MFEDQFIRQDLNEDRSIENTLELSWKLLSSIPEEELSRIDARYIQKYHPSSGKPDPARVKNETKNPVIKKEK